MNFGFKNKLASFGIAAIAALGLAGHASAATAVDVELSLLIDVSGSVDANEFALQRDGYVNAFKNTAIQSAITSTANGREGKIAVNLIYWSGASQQNESIPFTLIDSAASAEAFANAISAAARPFSNLTAPGSAINFAVPLFASNDFDGTKMVIDVSGDGEQNNGANTAAARDAALLAGIDRINGIAIGGGSSLLNWYTANIVGGTNGFALQAASFQDFEGAIARKLQAEITGTNPNPVPLPAAAWLLLSGVVALGAASRRRRAAA